MNKLILKLNNSDGAFALKANDGRNVHFMNVPDDRDQNREKRYLRSYDTF